MAVAFGSVNDIPPAAAVWGIDNVDEVDDAGGAEDAPGAPEDGGLVAPGGGGGRAAITTMNANLGVKKPTKMLLTQHLLSRAIPYPPLFRFGNAAFFKAHRKLGDNSSGRIVQTTR